jgi:hypothetical protein
MKAAIPILLASIAMPLSQAQGTPATQPLHIASTFQFEINASLAQAAPHNLQGFQAVGEPIS